MPDPVAAIPAAAAPAAPPAAAPAAPVPAPAAPAVPPAAPAAPAPVDSLIPADAPASAAPAAPAVPVVPATPDIPWLLADGTPGKGPPPGWFKADKYKTVEAQAQAYVALESRFGAFVGAPDGGKYEFKLPEGITGELKQDHPLLQGFNEWASKNQLSQEGYNQILGMFAQYEAAQAPDMAEVKKQVGENADMRIGAVTAWVKANLDAAGFQALRESMTGENAATVFKVIEGVIAKTRPTAPGKPGGDVPGGGVQGLAAIQAEHGKRDAAGRLLYATDMLHRQKVEKMYQDYYAAQVVTA